MVWTPDEARRLQPPDDPVCGRCGETEDDCECETPYDPTDDDDRAYDEWKDRRAEEE